MVKSLKTYRYFRAALAMVLLFSISLPLVRYACAMSGLTVTTPVSAPMCAVQDGVAACQTPASPLCPADGPCPSGEHCQNGARTGEADTCCKAEAVPAEKASFTESKLALPQMALPLLAVLTNSEATVARRFPFAPHEVLQARGGGVPLRVLFSSFVI